MRPWPASGCSTASGSSPASSAASRWSPPSVRFPTKRRLASCYRVHGFAYGYSIMEATCPSGIRPTNVMHAQDPNGLAAFPRATGFLTRLACAELARTGVELAPLLQRAGLSARLIDDGDAWLSV